MNYHVKYFVADSLSDMQYIIINWLIEERNVLIEHIVSTRIRPIEVLIFYTREK
jgi:hypothetical protein